MGVLDGKVAIVTGAAQGLGAAYASALSAAGASVAIFDLPVQGEKVAAVLKQVPGGLGVSVDITNRAAVMDAVEHVRATFGRVDILINNAVVGSTAASRSRPWYELPSEDWERTLSVNLGGTFNCCAAVAPHFIAQRSGKIVNVSSTVFWSPPPRMVHYVTTKAGVIGLTRALARELGPHGVTVNAVAPGFTRTETVAAIYPESHFQQSASGRAIPRVEEPADLVGTILYLCSPASDFVTGQVIVVDGGGTFD